MLELGFVGRTYFKNTAEFADLRIKDVNLVPDYVVIDVLVESVRGVDQDSYFAPDIAEKVVIGEREGAGNALGLFVFEQVIGDLKLDVGFKH